ncbi:hypothetical protein DL240_06850 [Lujinxingia litoralis]|uniref:Uncharacterized protein n=1 Tax=Lujinxingia litoralis TaxID=2211119 RepID=A0A328CD23_9DELT|nr:hypothetical protein DL240_06850 [Lujinxingia litoralis]
MTDALGSTTKGAVSRETPANNANSDTSRSRDDIELLSTSKKQVSAIGAFVNPAETVLCNVAQPPAMVSDRLDDVYETLRALAPRVLLLDGVEFWCVDYVPGSKRELKEMR